MNKNYNKYLEAKSDKELISIIVDEYKDKNLSKDELLKAADKGLAKARKRYDYKLGFSFNAYAVWWIRQSILQAIEAKRS